MNLFFGEEDFNNECCKIVFERLKFSDLELKKELKKLASKIVEDFSPKYVLDCSCVDAVLVSELRNLGVDAIGAIPYRNLIKYFSEEELKYCFYGSIVNDDFENIKTFAKYDLIICIKDEDFLSSLCFEKYINILRKLSSKILFGVVKKNEKEIQKPNISFFSSVFFINDMYRKLDYCLNFFNVPLYLFIVTVPSSFSVYIKPFDALWAAFAVIELSGKNSGLNADTEPIRAAHNETAVIFFNIFLLYLILSSLNALQ